MSAIVSVKKSTGYENYVMSDSNKVESMRKGGRGNQSTILTYTDKTEWVLLSNKPEERFCGFLYLQDALKKSDADKIKAAPNKMALYGKQVIYLSQYCGETKPKAFEQMGQQVTLALDIGFTDTMAEANLRKVGEEIFVFDTEKTSFHSKVHKKIDAFVQLHDAIRASLT